MPGPQDAERFEAHMSDSDALMWNIEKDPLLRSTIVTVLFFDRAPDWDTLVARIDRGSWLIPRMRQRVATPLLRMGPPHWSGDEHFDLSYHLRRVRVCEPTDDAVLDLARNAAMAGFDRARPLWEYTLVEGLEGGRAAFVMKVHHSMTDGVGGMKLLLMLFDFEREPVDPGPLDQVEAIPTFGATDLVLKSLSHRRRRFVGMARRAVIDAVGGDQRARPSSTRDRHARGRGRAAPSRATSRRRPRRTPRSCGPARWPAARHARRPARRPEARRQGGRRLAERRVRRGRDRRARQVPRVPRRVRRRSAHGHADQPARHVGPRSAATTSPRPGSSCPMTIKDPAERIVELGRLTRIVRDEPAVALTEALAGVLNQLPDHGHHRGVRVDAQGRRLRHLQRSRRAVPDLRGRRRARAHVRVRPARRAPRST